MQVNIPKSTAAASNTESALACESEDKCRYAEGLLSSGPASFTICSDWGSVAQQFERLWEAAVPLCTCFAASDPPGTGDESERAKSCEKLAALLKHQAAWHTQCLKSDRFWFVANACRSICRWGRRHRCWGSCLARRYVQEMQRVCWGLHGFHLDVGTLS